MGIRRMREGGVQYEGWTGDHGAPCGSQVCEVISNSGSDYFPTETSPFSPRRLFSAVLSAQK